LTQDKFTYTHPNQIPGYASGQMLQEDEQNAQNISSVAAASWVKKAQEVKSCNFQTDSCLWVLKISILP